ncbi:hypothetical protein ILUMI_20370 [Ignelater luminosus]|uniref:Uncharacterized protein n=1 Tax=Ignelater luminosus TaxID=2038154 RepID=A0A8K0CKR4_IGNLU|nr:hypothetical protein ILUMI_20370 [Ignelater luminosus]
MEGQKQQYEADLELYRTSSGKCLDKLKSEIEAAHAHSSVLLEKYEGMRRDLFSEKLENANLRKSLRDTIDNINQENAKHLEILRKKLAETAYKTAHVYARENLNMLQQQLAERDKLVSQLRQQQLEVEELVRRQQTDYKREMDKYKKTNEGLRNRVLAVQEKYANLERRRELEGEGFYVDVSNIRKELNRVKNNINKADHKCNVQDNVRIIENKVDNFHQALNANYSHKK